MDVESVVREVARTDPRTCDSAALTVLTSALHQLRCWLDAADAAVVVRADELAAAGAGGPACMVLTNGGRRSSREVAVVTDRAAVCAAMPDVHTALAAGTVSSGHADAIARATNRLDESGREELAAMGSELVELAARSTVETFDRKVRDLARRLSRDEGLRHHERLKSQRSVSRWTDGEGMCHTRISLDPESDARFSAVFDAAVAAEQAKPDSGRTFDQLKADAFLNLVAAPAAHGARRPAPEISVLIDLATLQHGLHETSVCETFDGQPLPPATVRRLACDAEIIPIVLGGDSKVVDVGRARRLATADQRRALRAMHMSCTAPDCQVRFGDCDIHHLKEWREGGATDLVNLIPLCSRHHHLIHEGQWRPSARAPAA
jgi:hypothetical protein